MSKIKIVTLIVGYFVGLVVMATPARAVSVVTIQSLPAYINTDNFKLSCTSDGDSAQFYVSKHGGDFVAFGGTIDLTTNQCLVQVTGAQFDGETDYSFKVNVDGTDSATTTTNYDTSGPSPVSGYRKERVNDGKYKLFWRNSDSSDFEKAIIYRGETIDFSADASHEIARVSGAPSSDMTYEDSFAPNAGKTYYYNIRAIDKAGNSSSLEGDGETTATVINQSGSSSSTGTGSVTSLPREGGSAGGSILGSETSPSSSPSAASTENVENGEVATGAGSWVSRNKPLALGIVVLLALAAYGFYRFTKK